MNVYGHGYAFTCASSEPSEISEHCETTSSRKSSDNSRSPNNTQKCKQEQEKWATYDHIRLIYLEENRQIHFRHLR